MLDIKAASEMIFSSVQKLVRAQLDEVRVALAAIDTRLAQVGEIAKQPGPRGEKGETGEAGAPGSAGERGEKGMDGRDGRDGEAGRDAVHIDVLSSVDSAKRYQRGTFATYRGGIIRAFRVTDSIQEGAELEKAGWHVVVNGFAGVDIGQNGERNLEVVAQMTSGEVTRKEFRFNHPLDRGVFREGEAYEKGDGVTFGGSWWIAQVDAPETKPGTSAEWRLAVKKGRDGRDVEK